MSPDSAILDAVPSPADIKDGYDAPGADPPLGSYASLAVVHNAALAGALVAARRAGKDLPERPDPRDIALTGVATFQISRLLTKSKVAGFVRAPFTELEGPAGKGEVSEKPRGRGLRRAVGELLVCPYCVGQWVSGGFAVGLVVAPRTTRFVAGVYATKALSDALQVAYLAAHEKQDELA